MREESYRLYSCRCCSVAVSICNQCDHGNIYCAGACAERQRRAALRRAGARYQRTRRGAHHHAARQHAWRQRRAQKVTHQGCATAGAVVTLFITAKVATMEPSNASSVLNLPHAARPLREHPRLRVAGHCAFCHAPLPKFTRLRTWRGWGFG